MSVLTAEGRIPDHHIVSRVAVILVLASVALSLAIPSGAAPASSEPPWSPAPPVVVRDATAIAASVYNQVGVTSTAEPVTPPVAVSGQPALRFTTPGGKELPGVFIYCAGYAPFCASERWAVVAALSRFGTFRDLGNMVSSSANLYANTPTFTFLRATFSSRYLAFKSDEYFGNEVSKSGTSYVVLQPLTAEERRLVDTYDNSVYFPALLARGEHGFPFIDIGNKFLSLTDYSPAVLAGLSRQEIAAGLSNPSSRVTQAIVASANYLTAAVCGVTGEKPTAVCSSKGVLAAAAALSSGS